MVTLPYLDTPNAASHNRIAFSSMASNTGERSPGEELMTWRNSAVRCLLRYASSRSAWDLVQLCCNSALARRSSATIVVERLGHLVPSGHPPNGAKTL